SHFFLIRRAWGVGRPLTEKFHRAYVQYMCAYSQHTERVFQRNGFQNGNSSYRPRCAKSARWILPTSQHSVFPVSKSGDVRTSTLSSPTLTPANAVIAAAGTVPRQNFS